MNAARTRSSLPRPSGHPTVGRVADTRGDGARSSNEFRPLTTTKSHVAHHNLAVLSTEDATTLDELLSRSEIRSLVWKRLDETHALVDTERIQLLIRRLKAVGHVPRFSESLPS